MGAVALRIKEGRIKKTARAAVFLLSDRVAAPSLVIVMMIVGVRAVVIEIQHCLG